MKQNGAKRQKITEKVFDIIQRNRDERSEKQARLINAIETLNIEDNPIDAFFRSMAMSVKQVSHPSQVKAIMEICRIVGELELKELQQSSTTMSVGSQPTTNFSTCSIYSTEAPASTYNLSTGTSETSQQYSRLSTSFSIYSVTSPET